MLTEDFWTLSGPGIVQTRVLGSRFSARAFPLDEDLSIESALEEIRKLYYDATHHCWALSWRDHDELTERHSDGGEPKGTAGLPILLELRKHNLQNCAVIVTRWFGGTKLGTGGLVRAYGECAGQALDTAPRVLRKTGVTVDVVVDFDSQSIVYQLATKFFAVVEANPSAEMTRLSVKVRRKQVDSFLAALREQSAGKLQGKIGVPWIS